MCYAFYEVRKMDNKEKYWQELKVIFDKISMKEYECVKKRMREKFVIHDKGEYFIVNYKDIKVMIFNDENRAVLCK